MGTRIPVRIYAGWRWLGRRSVGWWLGGLVLLGAVLALIQLLVVVGYGFWAEARPSGTLVVLGSKVEPGGQPSRSLKYRLDKGLALYRAGIGRRILVSGGLGREGYDEADVMARYLIERGVPDSAILRDPMGVSTYASARNTARLLAEADDRSVVIVSQYFHLLRSVYAFRGMGLERVSAEAADWFAEPRDLFSVPREVVACYYYAWRGFPEKGGE